MADWAPLAEGDPLPGDPGGIADLVGRLRAETQRIRAVAVRLRMVNSRDFWISESADEFAARVGRAAPDLDLAATRIETTATALQRYLQAMGDCQSRGRIAVSRAREADAEIARAQAGIQLEADQAVKDIAAVGIEAAQNPGVAAAPPASAWGPNWKSKAPSRPAPTPSASSTPRWRTMTRLSTAASATWGPPSTTP